MSTSSTCILNKIYLTCILFHIKFSKFANTLRQERQYTILFRYSQLSNFPIAPHRLDLKKIYIPFSPHPAALHRSPSQHSLQVNKSDRFPRPDWTIFPQFYNDFTVNRCQLINEVKRIVYCNINVDKAYLAICTKK